MLWLWVVGAFLFGAMFGAVIMGVITANDARIHEDRWWDDE